MNIRSIDLNLLAVFDAIYHEQNITRAAQRLGMSQPALSNALSRLRGTLNDELFVRTSKGMKPTSRAIEISGPIHNALSIIQHTITEQRHFDFANEVHTFYLAMSDYCEFVILPRLMRWAAENAPNIRFHVVPLVEETLARDLEAGKIDIAIGYIPFLETGFFRQLLMTEKFYSVVRKDHPTIQSELSLEQYQTIPQIITTPRRGETTIDQALQEQGVSRTVALRVPSFMTIASIISDTNYIGTLPARIAKHYLDLYKLKLFEPPIHHFEAHLHQHWHARVKNDPASQWLRGCLVNVCSEL